MKTIILSFLMIVSVYASEKSHSYTWNAFARQAIDASFSIKQDDAQLAIEKEKVSRSTLWKNPTFEMEFDNRFNNSVEYKYMEFSQKLPAWNENTHKKRAAEFELESKIHLKERTILQVQYEAASLFQKMKSRKRELDIVDRQLNKIEKLQDKAISRERSGDISGLERTRIDIMKQQVAMKKYALKNSYLKIKLEAQTLLKVDHRISLRGDPVMPGERDITWFIDSLKLSPEYRHYKAKVEASKEALSLAETTRYGSPELYVYSEREPIPNSSTDNFTGFGFRFSVPLWDRKDSQIEIQKVAIQKNTLRAEEVLYGLERNVRSSYALYKNISKELKKYKKNLLEPSKKYYEVSTRSFELGEKSLLELLDAQRVYFQNQLEYQTLILESNFYWLQLCHTASINLLKDNK